MPLTEVSILGGYFPDLDNTPPASDDFTIIIYEDEAASPDTICCPDPDAIVRTLSLGNIRRVKTGNNLAGRDIYRHEATFDPVELSEDKWYWLSVINESSEQWGWA